MIAKLLVHADDRASAIEAMTAAVDNFRIEGIQTNLAFHRQVLRHPDYVAGRVSTRWLENVFLPSRRAA
jgi:acetyl-CoA carboxylase biotin carboxylase subunit